MMLYEFVIDIDRQGVKYYRILEARLAVLELFGFVQADKFPRMVASLTHGMLKQVSTSLSTKVNRAPRYYDTWPLGILLRFTGNDTPAEQLGGNELMARTAALLMILIPCRPVAMIRMDCARARWAEPERVLVVPAKEKMGRGRGYTELVLRKMNNESLCPLRHYLLFATASEEIGCRRLVFLFHGRETVRPIGAAAQAVEAAARKSGNRP
jgi:hypothetical protein